MEFIQLENINILINTSTLIGMGFALRKLSSSISLFTSRVDNIEKEHKDAIIRIERMETRHEVNEQRINDIHISIARIEAKMDMFINGKKQ